MTKTIHNTLEPIGRPFGPGDIVGDEVVYLRDTSDWIVDPEGNKHYYRRMLVAEGDEWPEWGPNAQKSFVHGQHRFTVTGPGDYSLVYGLQVLDSGIVGPTGLLAALSCDCCTVEVFGFRARGNGVLQMPRQNYGLNLIDCLGIVSNCELGGFSLAINLGGGELSVQNNTWPEEFPNGVDICAGHGSPGRYDIGDTYNGLVLLGATGYKAQDTWINGIRMRGSAD